MTCQARPMPSWKRTKSFTESYLAKEANQATPTKQKMDVQLEVLTETKCGIRDNIIFLYSKLIYSNLMRYSRT